MNIVTREQAIEDFIKIFDVPEEPPLVSRHFNGNFFIGKRLFERHEVVKILKEWFKLNEIQGHYIEIAPITFIYTNFKIKIK